MCNKLSEARFNPFYGALEAAQGQKFIPIRNPQILPITVGTDLNPHFLKINT